MATVVSATIYAELKQRKIKAGRGIAAFGDPLYPKPSQDEAGITQSRSRGGLDHLQRLPHTAQEVQAIARAFPEQTRLYLQAEADEKNVKALGKGPGIIHLACHGWVDDRFPLESALAFSIPESFGVGDENGILQAWEVFSDMRIDADLLVLSACETGLGKIEGTEGLNGLTRAFQFAGARTIIASYWNVEDQSTGALMARFYHYLEKGEAKVDALRLAQIDLIRQPLLSEKPSFFGLRRKTVERDVSHPYYWAAFQLIGPWD